MADGETKQALKKLVVVTLAEAAVAVAHFLYGARLYDDPYRAHPVVPIIVALALVTAFAVLHARFDTRTTLWLLLATTVVPFVLLFGGYHGGYGHVAKVGVFAAGMSPERLAELFDSPDFVVPNDVLFEVSGALCFVLSLGIVHQLVRLVRLGRRPVSTPVLAGDA